MSDSDSSSAPKFIRQSLVGRSIFDIRASLHTPEQGEYLSNLDFLKAIAEKRDAETKKSQLIQATTALITLYMIFVAGDTSVNLQLMGVRVDNIKLFPEVLLVIISVGTFYAVTTTLNVILATLMIQAVFEHSGMEHYRYFIADKSISDLWASTLELKAFGYASGRMHQSLILTLALMMLLGALALPIVSAIVVAYFGVQFIEQNHWSSVSGLVCATSIMISSASVFYFVVAVFVPMKFNFRANDTAVPSTTEGTVEMPTVDGTETK